MEPINPPPGSPGPFPDKPDESRPKKKSGKRRQSGREPEQVESDNQMPGASGAHPEAPKRRKVEPSTSSLPVTSSEDKTVVDFVQFCYLDDEHHEPALDAESYVAQFCKLARIASRNNQKDYVLDVLKITDSQADLKFSLATLVRLLKKPKYNHLKGIEFIRTKMNIEPARTAPPAPPSSSSSSLSPQPESIEPPDSESSAVSEPPAVTHSITLKNILRDEETKTVVIDAIHLILGGARTFDAASEIQKSYSHRWSVDTSLNVSLRRWIMKLEPADGSALGFTEDQIRAVQSRYKPL